MVLLTVISQIFIANFIAMSLALLILDWFVGISSSDNPYVDFFVSVPGAANFGVGWWYY